MFIYNAKSLLNYKDSSQDGKVYDSVMKDSRKNDVTFKEKEFNNTRAASARLRSTHSTEQNYNILRYRDDTVASQRNDKAKNVIPQNEIRLA